MNYIVVSFLCDQFNALNGEFSKCIGDRGEFNGNFEQFRRRHQAISRSVHEADRFLMISYVACFCCQIVNVIIVLYSTIFYRQHTVLLTPDGAFVYILWLGYNLFGLSLAAGLAIIVNHMVSSLIRPPYVIGGGLMFYRDFSVYLLFSPSNLRAH